ncbi:HD domain-containing protein [Nocardia sp. NPDC051030]|uniref:HD domain-containing protein n=1 Tax=Nocardia sp. NPDC051030 TaxID=3155162 RepID=UPI003427AF91
MSTSILRAAVDRRLEPWFDHLGEDRIGYTNHVLRVLRLCDVLAAAYGFEPVPSEREEFLTSAAFHDLGVWTAGTFDYLAPSVDLAVAWLRDIARPDLIPVVTNMIGEHHRLRSAAAPSDRVEIFRRADAVDVEMGRLGRFGVSRAEYRRLEAEFPDAGFHRRLLQLGAKRLRTHPLSPLPMIKW